MTIDNIKEEVFGIINRPSEDSVWVSRVNSAVERSLSRLFQKINFEMFREVRQVSFNENGVYNFSKDFKSLQGVYPVKGVQPYQIMELSTLKMDSFLFNWKKLPPFTVIKAGVNLYLAPNKEALIDGYLSLTTASNRDDFETQFLENIGVYIIMDASYSLLIAWINGGPEQCSAIKENRDEVFYDIVNWNDEYNSKGPLTIIG